MAKLAAGNRNGYVGVLFFFLPFSLFLFVVDAVVVCVAAVVVLL